MPAERGMARLRLGLWIRPCLLLLVALIPRAADAHDVRPGAVSLREVAPDVFAVRVTRPRGPTGPPVDPRPRWPAGCTVDADRLRCADGLDGPLTLAGLDGAEVECLVAVEWLDGARFEALVDGGAVDIRRPSAHPDSAHPDSAHPDSAHPDSTRPTTTAHWIVSGIEHIVLGPDHLLFVLGLTLVVRRRRALIIAITGFTLAHSLTLGAAALGLLPPAGRAIELLIAASVLLLAVEATRPASRGPPPTARRPLLVVLPFGLLHGLGFAAPLLAMGLPADAGLSALFGFNVGVELGQLAALAVFGGALALWPGLRRPAGWLVGLVAGYWTVDRAVAWIGGLWG